MLAQWLGYPHPSRMEEELTGSEIGDWIRIMRVYPIGSLRDDLRSGLQTYYYMMAKVDRKAKAKMKPQDFMLKIFEEPKVPTGEELRDKIKAWTERNYGNSHK